MRIFIASGIFHPESGGPATYLHRILPEFMAQGHEVDVLTFGDAPTEGYLYPVTRVSRQQNFLRRQLAYYRAARSLWDGHDVAYIHSFTVPLPKRIRPRVMKIVGDPAWERATNKGWISPDTDIDVFQKRRYGFLIEANKYLRNRQARNLDHIIVPSNYLKEMVVGWGVSAEKITTIYNALEFPKIPSISRSEARIQLGLADKPLLLTVARLTPWKGVDTSIEAISNLKDYHLLVAGDGPQREVLEKLVATQNVKDRVHFLGRVPHEKMPLYYRAADYTLLYSGYEGLPHVLLESLNVGTPVIASDKGGNPEVVQHGVNGLLVPYSNVEALQAAIKEAFSGNMRERLAANAQVGLERFDWDKMVKQTIKVLNKFR